MPDHRRPRRGCPGAGPAPGRPPWSTGAEARPAAHDERADPLGAPELVGAHRHEVGHRASAAATSSQPTAATASVCSSAAGAELAHQRRPPRPAAAPMPTSLLTSITDTSPTPGPQPLGQRVEVDDPGAGPPPPSVPPRAAAGVEHGVVLDGGAHAPSRRRPRAGSPEDGEIVGLGPARGEDDLAGLAPEAPRHLVAGLVDGRPGPAGQRVRPRRVAEVLGQVRDHGRQRLRAHAAWWRRGRGRPASSKARSPGHGPAVTGSPRPSGLAHHDHGGGHEQKQPTRPRRRPPAGSRASRRREPSRASPQRSVSPTWIRRSPGHTTTRPARRPPATPRGPTTTKPSPDVKAPWLAAMRAKPNTGTPYRARPAQLTPGRKYRRTPSAPGAEGPRRARAGLDAGHDHGPEADHRAQDVQHEQDRVERPVGHGVDHGPASTGRPAASRGAIVAARPGARRQGARQGPGRRGRAPSSVPTTTARVRPAQLRANSQVNRFSTASSRPRTQRVDIKQVLAAARLACR